ncbi:MAG: alkaline phosphatase family protein [Chloroflexota bacterium]
MNKLRFVAALFLILLCVALPASAQIVIRQPVAPHGVARVILISLDGTRPDAIQQANAPVLQGLAAGGAVDWHATTVDPSVTLPAHTSMLTGLSVAEHGVTYNSTPLNCPPIVPLTFLAVAADNQLSAAIVAGKEKFCIFNQRLTVNYTFATAGDSSVVDRVIQLLPTTQVIFAHFPNPDMFGHATGWMSPTYIAELHNTDTQVGRIITTLTNLNLLSQTLVIITADHGGHDFGHGTTMPEDMTIPWIAYGAGIKPGTVLTGIRNADSAATILWALGLPEPNSQASRPIIEAFR